MAERVGSELSRLASLARIAVRVLPVDTNPLPRSWTHVTKVDPEDAKRLPLLYPRYLRHTDAVAVGGSTAVTPANTEATFALLAAVDRPTFHEPSDPSHVTDRTLDAAAFVAIPQVLNGSPAALVGDLGAGIERVREDLAPSLVAESVPSWTPANVRDRLADAATAWFLETAVFEAYLVQNPESAAAREAGVGAADVLSPVDARRRAMVADRYLRSPVVYVEYSGSFGGDDARRVLEAVRTGVSRSRVWYGGGLASRTDARRVLEAGADAVVVGNAFHDVATEEAALFERARDALALDVPRARVDEWLAGQVQWADTAAGAYLSTVPTLADPSATARRLLVDTVTVWLRLRSLAQRAPDPPVAALDRVVATAGVRSGGVDDDVARRWARAGFGAVDGATDPLATQLSPAASDVDP